MMYRSNWMELPPNFGCLNDQNLSDNFTKPERLPKRSDIKWIQNVLSCSTEFKKKINNNNLCEVVEIFPNYSDVLIQRILNDSSEFSRCVDNKNLCALVKLCPKYAEVLIQKITSDAVERKRLFKNSFDVFSVLENFPKPSVRILIQKILNDPVEFKVSGSIYRIICMFPEYTLPVVMDDPQRYFISTYADSVHKIITMFPVYAVAFVKKITENYIEFLRVFKNDNELQGLGRLFPQYKYIFNEFTIEEAVASIVNRMRSKSEFEIRKNINTLFNIFKLKLPNEIIIFIAAMTAYHQYHNERDATEIAHNQLITCEKKDLEKKAMPSVATLLNHHWLLNIKQVKDSRQQHEFDKLHGLVIFSGKR